MIDQKADRRILLIRVNALAELRNTEPTVRKVRSAFPGGQILAVSTPESEGLHELHSDPRIDEVLIFPPDPHSSGSPAAFRAFLRGQNIDATVACVGATRGLDYSRHVLSLLFCPGRKWIINGRQRLYPLMGPRGIASVAGAAYGLMARRIRDGLIGYAINRCKRHSAADTTLEKIRDQEIRRILWIEMDGIGDLVMQLPALQILRDNFPDATIDALVRPVCAPVLQDVRDIDRVITYDPPTILPGDGLRYSLGDVIAMKARLLPGRYDLAIETRGRENCRILAGLSEARFRVGPAYNPPDSPHANGRVADPMFVDLMTHVVSAETGGVHETHSGKGVAAAMGLTPRRPFTYVVPDHRLRQIDNALRNIGVSPRSFAVVHARASTQRRNWLPDRFAHVVDHVAESHDMDVLLVGAQSDSEYNESILAQARAANRVRNVAGAFSLADLPALFTRAQLMVSVDTGPMHLAALAGTPLVALFLPCFAAIHSPLGQPESVISPDTPLTLEQYSRSPDVVLLQDLTVETVIQKVDEQLLTTRHSRPPGNPG